MTNRRPISTWCAAQVLSVVLATASAGAQQPDVSVPAGPLTLEQVLAVAEARSESIAAARAGVRRAEGDEVRARSGRYPQLTVFASYDRALASEFEGIFDTSGGPPCDPFALNPGAALDARVAEIERAIDCGAIGSAFFGEEAGDDGDTAELPFGRQNTWRVTLGLTQTLYSGGRLGARAEAARAGHEAAELTLTAARAQILFDVTEAYYDAALSERLVAIAEATIGQAEATFLQVQAGFKAGTQPEFEMLRARVARDNQRPMLIRQRANREVALLRLRQLLELPPNAPIDLTASLDSDQLGPPPPFATRLAAAEELLESGPRAEAVAEVPLPDRVAVREVATQVRLREASLAAVRAERMPTVEVNTNYGRVAYPAGMFPRLDSFRTNWTIGASVQVPVLTGGRQRGDEMVTRAELEQARLQFEQTEELAALDTRSAWAELIAARAAWEASAGTIQQAVRAYDIANVRYRAGVSTQLELSDARLLLQQSEANRAQAARDLQVARARVALLPELPLSAAGALRMPQQQLQPAAPFTPSAPQTPLGGGQLRNAAAQQRLTPTGVRP